MPRPSDDGLMRGGSDEFDDEEDDDPEARIYAELLEEEAAKKRAAALEALNEINTGQVGPIPCAAMGMGVDRKLWLSAQCG